MMLLNKKLGNERRPARCKAKAREGNQGRPPESQPTSQTWNKTSGQLKLHYRIVSNSLTQSALQMQTQTQTSAQLCALHNHIRVQALLAQVQGPRNATSLHHSFLFIPAISTHHSITSETTHQ